MCWMKQLLFSVFMVLASVPAFAESPIFVGDAGQETEAIVVVDHVVSGDTSIFLPALAGTESLALYRVEPPHPQVLFSLATPVSGVSISAEGRLVVQDAATPGRIDIVADIGEAQALQMSIDLVVPHGPGVDMVHPEWVPKVKAPASMYEEKVYSMLRYILLAVSGLAFVTYIYGRRRNGIPSGSVQGK